jgi:hypothetical protein
MTDDELYWYLEGMLTWGRIGNQSGQTEISRLSGGLAPLYHFDSNEFVVHRIRASRYSVGKFMDFYK